MQGMPTRGDRGGNRHGRPGVMRDRAAPGIGAEILTLVLVLACLAGTFGVVLTLHRQAHDMRRPKPTPAPVVAAVAPPPATPSEAKPPPPPARRPKPIPPAPPVDPTPVLVAEIAAREAAERAQADAAAAEAKRLASDREA